ncbi:MAG: hypothetical protein CSB48_09200 [Proteobacteria bacterium]|nr:MAG: hypothetical protein CSB48_09200 [Pseudomonadota bacterium]
MYCTSWYCTSFRSLQFRLLQLEAGFLQKPPLPRNLGDNHTIRLPESICQLTQLKELYLYRSHLTSLPENFYQLPEKFVSPAVEQVKQNVRQQEKLKAE